MNTKFSPNYLGDENIGIAKAGDLIIHARYSSQAGDREVWMIRFFDLNMVKIGEMTISTGTMQLGNPLEMIRSACSFMTAYSEAWLHGREGSENRDLFDGKVGDFIVLNDSEIQMLAVELEELASSDADSDN
jgi:hypothetical protein